MNLPVSGGRRTATPWGTTRPLAPLVAGLTTLTLLLAGCQGAGGGAGEEHSRGNDRDADRDTVQARAVEMEAEKAPKRPNVVMVLMDDFSMDLLDTMRSAQRMQRRGASYDRSYVVDSLCCVSRSSLLTGQYPHQTGVRTNTAGAPTTGSPLGGWASFQAHGNEKRTVARRLQARGYTTGFTGKFLNEYEVRPGEIPEVPPGWDEWQVLFGSAYDGWDFQSSSLDDQGSLQVIDHPAPPADASDAEKDAAYAGTVVHDNAIDFMKRHAKDDKPYFLEVAPYGPHSRVGPDPAYPGDPMFPPAFSDRPGHTRSTGDCGALACDELTTERLPGFGDDPVDNAPRRSDGSIAPAWRPAESQLDRAEATESLHNRARMVASIDRMVGDILDHADKDTVVILTSDNGFHLGQHGLDRGKGTPYASDVQVPLLVVGPGVEPGVRHEAVSNIDLAPTLEELAGLRPQPYRAGTSLVPTFADPDLHRRDYVFFENTQATEGGVDPDRAFSGGELDRIPSYVAVRGPEGLLVRLDLDPAPGEFEVGWEFYPDEQITGDRGYEQRNAYATPRYRDDVQTLTRRLRAFERCQSVTGDAPVSRACRDLTR